MKHPLFPAACLLLILLCGCVHRQDDCIGVQPVSVLDSNVAIELAKLRLNQSQHWPGARFSAQPLENGSWRVLAIRVDAWEDGSPVVSPGAHRVFIINRDGVVVEDTGGL